MVRYIRLALLAIIALIANGAILFAGSLGSWMGLMPLGAGLFGEYLFVLLLLDELGVAEA